MDDQREAGRPAPDNIVRLMHTRLDACRSIVRQGRILDAAIRGHMFSSPELTMLLDLYLAHYENRETCLWEVCHATTIPFSTAHRKLRILTDRGLIVRTNTSHDHRRVDVRLAESTVHSMDELFDRLSSLRG